MYNFVTQKIQSTEGTKWHYGKNLPGGEQMKENFMEKPNPERGLKELTADPQASPLPLYMKRGAE